MGEGWYLKLELEFLSRASCRVNLEKKEKKAQMGKRKDSVDVVTLKDILNEAGWLRHELAIILLITIFLSKRWKGLSENKYLQFGAIWRDFGARDKNASCRKMDQFIFFEDIHEFAVQLCRTWGVPVPDFGTY